MIFASSFRGIGGNGARALQCSACGSLVTHSDHLLALAGMNRHVFVNPSGIECDFQTFVSCPGAIALGDPTTEHTWFSGYVWSMAFCRYCGQHLGWYYQGMSQISRPTEFWGILVSRMVSPSS